MTISNMNENEQIDQLKPLLSPAQNVLVVFPATASFDQAALATSLGIVLEKMGKRVSLLSPDTEGSKVTGLTGLDKVSTKVGNQNLNVIFDYKKESIDKVSYHIDEESQKFYLVIQPQKGFPPLEVSAVSFDYAGMDADLIFLVGVSSLESLDGLYAGYEDLYKDTTTISIHNYQTSFANINLDISGKTSFSEFGVGLIEGLGGELDSESATNLLSGIEETTQSFSSFSTTANTFATAAKLMQQGARRTRRKMGINPPPNLKKEVSGKVNGKSKSVDIKASESTSKPFQPSSVSSR